jgi:hypothetical protein
MPISHRITSFQKNRIDGSNCPRAVSRRRGQNVLDALRLSRSTEGFAGCLDVT